MLNTVEMGRRKQTNASISLSCAGFLPCGEEWRCVDAIHRLREIQRHEGVPKSSDGAWPLLRTRGCGRYPARRCGREANGRRSRRWPRRRKRGKRSGMRRLYSVWLNYIPSTRSWLMSEPERQGRVHCMRNVNPIVCPHSALAFYFVNRWGKDGTAKNFPSFRQPEDYYDLYAFPDSVKVPV